MGAKKTEKPPPASEPPPRDRPEWTAGRGYVVGVRCTWRGVVIVCCQSHHAGDAADHPWDPGHGWPARKAAALWAPAGKREAEKMLALGRELPHPAALAAIG